MIYSSDPDGNGSDMQIPAGRHVYQFTFVLPNKQLPMSFETQIGHVRYTIKATVDRPWAIDYTTTKPFMVLNTLDLNTVQDASVSFH